jgi:hypothetical protein
VGFVNADYRRTPRGREPFCPAKTTAKPPVFDGKRRYTSHSMASTGYPRALGDSTADSFLKMLRYLGMLGFLGGLAAMSAMWAFGPRPSSVNEWNVLIGAMRPIFYACFFSGIVVLALAGGVSWWRHRKQLHGARWFRVMMTMVVIAIPALHLSARYAALSLYAAIENHELERALELWDRLGRLYLIGFLVMLTIAAIGVFKPRFGQKVGTSNDRE